METGRAEDRGPGPPAPRGPAEEKPGKGDAGEPPGAGRRNEEGGGPGISRRRRGADSGAKCCCKTTENEDREEPVGSGRMKAVGDLGRAVSVAPGNRVQAEWTRQRWRRWCGAGGQALLRVRPGPVVAAGSRGRGVGPRGAAPPCGAGGRWCGGGGMRGLRSDHRTVGSCRCSGPA